MTVVVPNIFILAIKRLRCETISILFFLNNKTKLLKYL